MEFSEEVVVDGVGGSFDGGRGIIGGRGFSVDGDFGEQWVQQVLKVGPGNNYIEKNVNCPSYLLDSILEDIFVCMG